ncbi:MAG: mycofactocin system GMC family oxidoreductase MftG [SAR202 cluster bacterium]|nr:mycofactocin system GMC family oxidoreductase MftG [SAR202 cluster bacterium]
MKYDVVIVGAGASGAALAARLSEDVGVRVLVLEEGPDYPTLEATPRDVKHFYGKLSTLQGEYVWRCSAYVNEEQGLSDAVMRGRCVGGSSAINGAVLFRGLPGDFDGWTSLGNSEWSFEKVLPYFKRMECDEDFGGEFHGRDGPMPVRRAGFEEMLPVASAFYQACLAKGFAERADLNSPEAVEGVGPHCVADRNGLRVNTSMAYLWPARQRKNLTIIGNRKAQRVVLKGSRAVGVEVVSGREVSVVEAGEVILSAGAIGSPFILMHSGIGPKEVLESKGIRVRHDLPGVGRHLMNHVSAPVAFKNGPGLRRDVLISQVILRWTSSGSAVKGDMSLAVDARYDIDGAPHTRLGVGLQSPKSEGYIELVSSDPEAAPVLHYRALSEGEDMRRMREGVRMAVDMRRRAEFQGLFAGLTAPGPRDLESEGALEEWIRLNVKASQHYCGTCRMGTGDEAVVDQWCRVRGMEGLRVVDASIMPGITRPAIYGTCVMIGERAADLVKGTMR